MFSTFWQMSAGFNKAILRCSIRVLVDVTNRRYIERKFLFIGYGQMFKSATEDCIANVIVLTNVGMLECVDLTIPYRQFDLYK